MIGPIQIIDLTPAQVGTLRCGPWISSEWDADFRRCFNVIWDNCGGSPEIARSHVGDTTLEYYDNAVG